MRVGIDVGGTTVKIGVFDNYQVIDKFVVETKKETLFTDVCESIKKRCNEKNYIIDKIGIGLPGHVVGNVIDKLPNVGIENMDLEPIFKKYFPSAVGCI